MFGGTMTFHRVALLLGVLLLAIVAGATIFGSVRGLIHDPQHRPVQGSRVVIRAEASDWTQTTTSDSSGEFHFDAVPLGAYTVTVEVPGFAPQEQRLALTSGRDARLHFSLAIAKSKETVEVVDTPATINPESSTTTSVVSREQISQTPGADQTNSLAMITNYVPSAYVVHDQLHIRGGHQVTWLLDGVPVPNTNIASNVGPQFDPKDIDYLEVQRGGYSAEYGDRTFGVFNVVTRSGFERDRQAELVTSYGSFNRSEEHTSELQSPCNLVCRLLLEKKKTTARHLGCPTVLYAFHLLVAGARDRARHGRQPGYRVYNDVDRRATMIAPVATPTRLAAH